MRVESKYKIPGLTGWYIVLRSLGRHRGGVGEGVIKGRYCWYKMIIYGFSKFLSLLVSKYVIQNSYYCSWMKLSFFSEQKIEISKSCCFLKTRVTCFNNTRRRPRVYTSDDIGWRKWYLFQDTDAYICADLENMLFLARQWCKLSPVHIRWWWRSKTIISQKPEGIYFQPWTYEPSFQYFKILLGLWSTIRVIIFKSDFCEWKVLVI